MFASGIPAAATGDSLAIKGLGLPDERELGVHSPARKRLWSEESQSDNALIFSYFLEELTRPSGDDVQFQYALFTKDDFT